MSQVEPGRRVIMVGQVKVRCYVCVNDASVFILEGTECVRCVRTRISVAS